MEKGKIKFSHVISTVQFERGELKIKQLRLPVLILIGVFLCVLVWLGVYKGSEFPLIIQISLGFSILILLWALFDISTMRISFLYRPASDYLKLNARRRNLSVSYTGTAQQRLSLGIQNGIGTNTTRAHFFVVLNYEDDQCHIPFTLSGGFHKKEKAEEQLNVWSEKLGLKSSQN